MKKKGLIIIFILSQVVLIFLYIHKESLFIKNTYQGQKLTKIKKDLSAEKQKLKQNLHLAQNKSLIKKIALNELGMTPNKLNQIKIINDDNTKA